MYTHYWLHSWEWLCFAEVSCGVSCGCCIFQINGKFIDDKHTVWILCNAPEELRFLQYNNCLVYIWCWHSQTVVLIFSVLLSCTSQMGFQTLCILLNERIKWPSKPKLFNTLLGNLMVLLLYSKFKTDWKITLYKTKPNDS